MKFEAIYERCYRPVYRFALSLCRDEHTAEEIAQETFVKAMAGYRDFRGGSDVTTWLCRIAKNVYFSGRRKRTALPLETLPEVSDGLSETIADALSDREMALQIHRHLHELDEPYREVFTLRVFGELSHGQIGALFGRTEVWARTTFYRAKTRLQERIRDQHE